MKSANAGAAGKRNGEDEERDCRYWLQHRASLWSLVRKFRLPGCRAAGCTA
uniref:Uncharacterized protein n=1 Tax=Aegilops tauschii TaxID=37682 RepID=R7WE65_AEGTA